MIFGTFDRASPREELSREVRGIAAIVSAGQEPAIWAQPGVALCSLRSGPAKPPEAFGVYTNPTGDVAVVVEGEFYNPDEIARVLGTTRELKRDCLGQALIQLYERGDLDFLGRVNGKFAFALWDGRKGRLVLGRDRLGIEPLFYAQNGTRFLFGSSLTSLLAAGQFRRELDPQAVLYYLLFCYNPGEETLVRGVRRVPAASLLSIRNEGASISNYWRLSFAETEAKTLGEQREDILGLIEDAIRIRLDEDREPGVLLSGGTDSSAIVSLASRLVGQPFPTFSFRCEGRSYDESQYARLVAEKFGTDHTEILYKPEALFSISEAVQAMDEPFCDAGIEMGTHLLGRTAQGGVSYVLSGEGGDELFAGHPVYVADKVAVIADLVPAVAMRPLTRVLQSIPDSDQKKNLQVKLKRFAYSLSFPRELLSHRWRIYYSPSELRELCTSDFLAECDLGRMFDPVLKFNAEADGGDRLSRSLYSDFHTLVSFYLRRLSLLRAFGVESRTPLLDHRLVEYAARIPSRLKIRRLSDTKYVYRRVLEGVVPREILHDRPKLGHSVPMKNWLRQDGALKEWFRDTLVGSTLRERGMFKTGYVERLLGEHEQKKHNHTHRLWGLMVLESWLNKHWDRSTKLR